MFVTRRAALGWTLALLYLFAARLRGQGVSEQPSEPPTYYEFGRVVAIWPQTIDLETQPPIQTLTSSRPAPERHSFALAPDTQADLVQVGDTVEAIYTANGNAWTLRRLIALHTGIPRPGLRIIQLAPSASTARAAVAASPGPVSAAKPAASAGKPAPVIRQPAVPTSAPAPTRRAEAKPPVLASPLAVKPAPAAAKATPSSVALPSSATPKPSAAVPLTLGETAESLPMPGVPGVKAITRATPSEECHRSDPDWPSEPLHIAVLDFRYPSERDEERDLRALGGGSGTLVADLIFNRLAQDASFAVSRGDREKLYRADFAGAARTGRQLGADAVFAGTFVPIEPPAGEDPYAARPKEYELRAGIVDTCTGQLLLKLNSETCPQGAQPESAACSQHPITAKEAEAPKDNAAAFQLPIDALLAPLEHPGATQTAPGPAGVVTAANNAAVTLRLAPGALLKAGDQVAVHALRLAKSPSTYTLHYLQDEEIGRLSIRNVQGQTAVGIFTGEFPPHPGDTAEFIQDP